MTTRASISLENCEDGIDNDRDGLIDAADPDCQQLPTVQPATTAQANSPPVAVCQDSTVTADDSCEAEASVDGGSYDPEQQSIVVSQDPAAPYQLGPTTVTLTVSDGSDSASCSATVTVVDATPPTISDVPDVTLECPASIDPMFTGFPTTADNCGFVGAQYTDLFAQGCSSTGVTTRTWTTTDAAGGTASSEQVITVQDTTPPTVSIVPAVLPPCLWPPNGRYFCIDNPSSIGSLFTGSDTCSPAPLRVTGVACTSSQPDDDTGDSATHDDCFVDADRVCFRAERKGNDPAGRYYTVSAVLVDQCGNSAPASGQVFVAHATPQNTQICSRGTVPGRGSGRP